MSVNIKIAKANSALKDVVIPQIPYDLLNLKKELESPFTNISTVVSIIERNTLLSGELLNLLDSNYFKAHEKITSIKTAVDFVGLDTIYELVVTASLKKLFKGKGLLNDMIDHCVDVAFCMADLIEKAHIDSFGKEDAYLLGLFHNIGALVLASKDEDAYAQLHQSSMTNPILVIAKEEEVFDTNHCFTGFLVAQKWNLPRHVLKSILTHHNRKVESIMDDDVRAMVSMLKISNALVSEVSLGAYIGSEMKEYLKDGQEDLMLSDDDISEIRKVLTTYCHKESITKLAS